MEPYNFDYLPDNDNFNGEEEEDEYPINNEDINSDDNYYEDNQNKEEMFDVFDEIHQNFEEISKNLKDTKIKQKIYEKKTEENFRRLNENRYKKYNYNINYEDDLNLDNKFQYTFPSRMKKQFMDISGENNNYINYNTSSNYNQINSKGSFFSNNNLGIKDDSQINNNSYQNNEYINQNNLNYNPNEIKKGFIKKSNSNANMKNNNNENNLLNENNIANTNKKDLSNEIEKVMNEFNDMRAQNKNLIKENKILQDLLNKDKKNFAKELKAKDCKIEELLKENKKLKNSDLEISKVSDFNNSKKSKTNLKSKKFESLQDDYDRIFNENLKLKEENKTLSQELDEKKEEKEQYKQALIENKNLSEENYQLKGKIITLNNDNVI